jgi:hypothetical protein
LKKKYILVAILIMTVFLTAAFSVRDGNSGTFTMGEELRVKEGEEVNGDAAVIFGDAIIDGVVDGEFAVIFGDADVSGTIDGNLAVIFGDATIDGRVEGNVAAIFGDIIAGNNAVIGGNAAAVAGQVKKSTGSIIQGEIASVHGPFRADRADLVPLMAISSIIGLVVFFGLSALLLVLIPDRMNFMVESAPTKIWRRFGIGIAAYLMFIPAIIALAITIIGMLLIPIFIAGFFLTAFIGMAALKLTIGRRITGKLEGRGAPYIYLLVGSILVFVLPFIPVLGWLAYIFAASVGLGLVLDTRLGKPKARAV